MIGRLLRALANPWFGFVNSATLGTVNVAFYLWGRGWWASLLVAGALWFLAGWQLAIATGTPSRSYIRRFVERELAQELRRMADRP